MYVLFNSIQDIEVDVLEVRCGEKIPDEEAVASVLISAPSGSQVRWPPDTRPPTPRGHSGSGIKGTEKDSEMSMP